MVGIRAVLVLGVISLVLGSGCVQSPKETIKEVIIKQYVCWDKSIVATSSRCPPQPEKIKEVTIEKTKYVCWNNKTVDTPSRCTPQPEKIIEKIKEVKIETIKYVCSTGQIVNNATECPTPHALTGVKTFSGTTEDVTEEFYLKRGLVIITGHYEGDSNFIVYLIDSNGNVVDYIFNNIGNFDGKHATQISKDGYYRLALEGIVSSEFIGGSWYSKPGKWTLKIEQSS